MNVFEQLESIKIPIAGNAPISLLQLLTLIGWLVLVVLAARLIGTIVKQLVLKPLKINRGRREAAGTILTYLLIAVGALTVLDRSGIQMRSLTIFAGTVGIGLGIGLQTLASHFVSGLILLFEQPIKVGDFVEVDGLLGTVEKISARSTIVRTLDRVSVIVPNSRFIDNNVVNWSYQDPRSRLHIPVGVAYGSDMMLVTEALLAAARRESRALRQPSPKVWFTDFGDSALNFELLVWINNPIDTQPIRSALNYAIEAELRLRNIEIPFPQRDLHLKDIDRIQQLLQPKHYDKPPTTPPAQAAVPIQPEPRLSNINLRELLRRISYFERCHDWELRQLVEFGYRQSFRSGDIIVTEGEPGSSFYIVLSGATEVYLDKLDQKVLATRGVGEFFGEMSLMLDAPRSASIRATEDTLLFVVERSNLQPILQRHPELADHISEELSQRIKSLQDLGVQVGSSASNNPIKWIRAQITKLFDL